MSFKGTTNPAPVDCRTTAAVPMAKTPARNTVGMVSSTWRQRKATVNEANPSAETKAATLPAKWPIEIPSLTITAMPAVAASMAHLVPERTLSFNRTLPRMAAKKGAAANRNMALATVVFWIP